MSRQYTVASLATKVRQRGDYENSDFITDAILIDFIDSAHTEVYDLLVGKWEDYYTVEATFSLTSGSDAYTLPADFYKLLGVDILDGTLWKRLRKYNLHDRNRQGRLAYRLQGGSLKFAPVPTSTDTIQLTYIPTAPILTALTDSIDGVNGWEELVVLFALRRCQVREESSVTATDNAIGRQLHRLESAADARDAGDAESIQDITAQLDWYY